MLQANAATFFSSHPVFRQEEFLALATARGATRESGEQLLAYHVRRGRLVRVRRGLYQVVPPGVEAARAPLDPFLIAGRLAEDACLAYHTALEFFGAAYSVHERFVVTSQREIRPFTFRGHSFLRVEPPLALRRTGLEALGVEHAERRGVPVRVTSLERAMVDVLDRPELGGGWEEIWRSLATIGFLDLELVVAYALALGNATTIAKVGLYLEQHQDRLMVGTDTLERLRARRPKAPHAIQRGTPGRLVAGWNLVVPDAVLRADWEAVG